MIDIELFLYDGEKKLGARLTFVVVPRVGEVIWLHTGKLAEPVKKMFGATAFVVTGVYYHFYDNGNGAYIEAEIYKS